MRFTNEAGNYNAMGGAFHAFDPTTFTYPNQPCWLVFDHAHKQRYDVAGCPPGDDVPDWMLTGDTVEELAAAMGVPADALRSHDRTLQRPCCPGRRPRLRSWHRAPTTPSTATVPSRVSAATLHPLDTARSMRCRIESGSLGTNGGPKTDTRGRVLALDGGVIDGLYAAGNVMAAPTGMVYGGAGGTLGPAMTFGWIAGP